MTLSRVKPGKQRAYNHYHSKIKLIYLNGNVNLTDEADRHLLVVVISGCYQLERFGKVTELKSGYIAAITYQGSQPLLLENVGESNGIAFICSMDFSYIEEFYERYTTVFTKIDAILSSHNDDDVILIRMSSLVKSSAKSLMQHFYSKYEHQRLIIEMHVNLVLVALVAENDIYKAYFAYLCKPTVSDLKVRLKKLLLEYANSDVPINKIADKGGFSTTAFNKLVREHLGLPPRQWINRVRLEKSMTLLKNKNNSVAYVCHEVGFESQSYFSVIFKKEFGISPKKYQKSLNEKKKYPFEIV